MGAGTTIDGNNGNGANLDHFAGGALAAIENATPATARPRKKARGGTGTSIRSGYITDEEPNPDLVGAKWYGSPGSPGIAQKMMLDPHVSQSVDFIADPLGAARWGFTAGAKDDASREAADFCNWIFLDRLPWRQLLRRTVKSYSSAGFSLDEITDDVCSIPQSRFPRHLGGGTGIVPTKFHDRPPWTVNRWFQSKRDPTELAAIEQSLQGSDQEPAGYVKIAGSRLLRYSYDQEGAYFPGRAVLRPAYQPWKLRIAFLTIDAIKHERTGDPVPELTLNEDPAKEDIDIAHKVLGEMRAQEKQYLLLPYGYKFRWAGASENESSNIDLAISRCNLDIAWNVGASFMHLGLTNRGAGSYAVGGTQIGAYHLAIDAQASFVEDVFNLGLDGWSIVERYVRLNYGPDVALPRLRARNLPTRNWIETTKTVNASVAAGTITADEPLEDLLRDGMDLGPRDESTSREKPVSLGTQPKDPEPPDEELETDDELDDTTEEPTE